MGLKQVKIVGVPMDLGSGRRGVDMGPSALRIAGIRRELERLGYTVVDHGDISVPIPETQHHGDPRAKYLPEIAETCESLCKVVKACMAQQFFPIVLGGDHSVAIGTISGLSAYYRERSEKIGLLWFDAHGDMNTPETTPSGNIHGMPLAVCLGYGAPPLVEIAGYSPKVSSENTVLIGVRNLDPYEKKLVHDAGVKVFTMRDIDELGMKHVILEALEVAGWGTSGIHVSIDMDVVDPGVAGGVGTPVRGGLSYREAHLAMELIADSGKLSSLELMEVNPILDHMNATAELGVELISSAMGKSIL